MQKHIARLAPGDVFLVRCNDDDQGTVGDRPRISATTADMAAAEEMSDDDLEALHAEYRRRAEHTEMSLAKRRRGH